MEKFYTTQEVEKLLGKSRTTVARLAVKHHWTIEKRVANGTVKTFYLKQEIDSFRGVPAIVEEQKKNKTRTVALKDYKAVDELPDWNQKIAWARYFICLQLEKDYEQMEGSKDIIIHQFVQDAKKRFPEKMEILKRISVGTLRRWWGIYTKNKQNPLALATQLGKSRGYRKMSYEIAIRAKNLYLSKNKPTMMKVYTRILLEFGEDAVTYPTIRNFLNHDINNLAKDYGRLNFKDFNDKHKPFVVRDHSKLKPNDLWVSDGHDFEFMCYHPCRKNADGSRYIGTPKWILWMDVRSRYIVGWTISWGETTESIALALKNGIEKYGRPLATYTDNGKAYKSKVLKGCKDKEELTGIYAALGIEKDKQRHAIAYNAQAKNIERMFVDFKQDFAVEFPTYKGGHILERPDTLKPILKKEKQLVTGEVLELSEVEAYLEYWVAYRNDKYYRFRRGHRGDGMDGKTPKQWMDSLPESERIRISDEKLRMLFMYEDIRKVTQNGVVFMQNTYIHEELFTHLGDKVKIKYDPHNLKEVFVYLLTGEFLCKADRLEKYGWDGVEQYKEHRKRLQKFQASIKKTLEIKQEIVDNDIITYAEEAQERTAIIENIKSEKKKETVKVITVGGIEFEVEDDE